MLAGKFIKALLSFKIKYIVMLCSTFYWDSNNIENDIRKKKKEALFQLNDKIDFVLD
jgi:hypothetical protein